jgi:hypothetical protein
MISFMISVVPPKINWTWLSRQSRDRAGEHRLVLPGNQGRGYLVSVSCGVRAARVGWRSPAMGSSRRVTTPRAVAWSRRRRRTSGRGYPSHRCGRRRRAHRGTAATDPRDARSRPRQPGAVVLRRAAARQSVPRPGSGRSPPHDEHVRRSMTTAAAGPSPSLAATPSKPGVRLGSGDFCVVSLLTVSTTSSGNGRNRVTACAWVRPLRDDLVRSRT